MDDIAAPSPAKIIDRQTPCARCEYNLQGVARDGNCPECGSTIAPSLGLIYLRDDPRSVKSLRWLVWLLLIFLSYNVIANITAAIGLYLPSANWNSRILMIANLVTVVVLGFWISLIKSLQVPRFLPIWLQISLAIWCAMQCVFFWVAQCPGSILNLENFIYSLQFIAAVIFLSITICFGLMIGRAIARIPKRALLRQGRLLLWGLGFSLLARATVFYISVWAFEQSLNGQIIDMGYLFLTTAVIDVAVGLWAVYVILLLNREIAKIMSETRATTLPV